LKHIANYPQAPWCFCKEDYLREVFCFALGESNKWPRTLVGEMKLATEKKLS
jgi:hypothetical protein